MTASPFSEWVISQHEILSWECRAQGVCLSAAPHLGFPVWKLVGFSFLIETGSHCIALAGLELREPPLCLSADTEDVPMPGSEGFRTGIKGNQPWRGSSLWSLWLCTAWYLCICLLSPEHGPSPWASAPTVILTQCSPHPQHSMCPPFGLREFKETSLYNLVSFQVIPDNLELNLKEKTEEDPLCIYIRIHWYAPSKGIWCL